MINIHSYYRTCLWRLILSLERKDFKKVILENPKKKQICSLFIKACNLNYPFAFSLKKCPSSPVSFNNVTCQLCSRDSFIFYNISVVTLQKNIVWKFLSQFRSERTVLPLPYRKLMQV